MDTLSEERIELMAELGASFAVLCMTPTPVLCQQLLCIVPSQARMAVVLANSASITTLRYIDLRMSETILPS